MARFPTFSTILLCFGLSFQPSKFFLGRTCRLTYICFLVWRPHHLGCFSNWGYHWNLVIQETSVPENSPNDEVREAYTYQSASFTGKILDKILKNCGTFWKILENFEWSCHDWFHVKSEHKKIQWSVYSNLTWNWSAILVKDTNVK